MRGKKLSHIVIPIVILLVLLSCRLFFSFQLPYLDDDSYKNLVKAENVAEEDVFSNSVFYYVLFLILLITKNVLFLKILSNVFFVLAGVMVYFIALRLSKSRFFSFVSALTAGFLPVFFSKTFNWLNPFSFGLFLLFFTIYAYLNSDKRFWTGAYIVSFIIFCFTHWLVIVYILGLVFYHLFLRLEGIKQKPAEVELSLFSVFFGLWAQILVYKDVLFLHGLNFLTLNIPKIIMPDYYPLYSFSVIMTFLGIIPVLAGLYLIYKYSFEKKAKQISFVISFIAVIAVLFWLRFCFTDMALMLLGLFFCVIFAKWLFDMRIFVKKTKSAGFVNLFSVLLIILLLVIIVPANLFYINSNFNSNSVITKEKVDALYWIKDNTPEDSVILSLPEEGSLLTYFADRKAVMNDDFLSIPNAEQRLTDVYRIYNTQFQTEAVELLDKYGVSYILFSPAVKDKFKIDNLAYVESGRCFQLMYKKGSCSVYMKFPECRLKEV